MTTWTSNRLSGQSGVDRQSFEQKALDYFAEVIIDKALIHEAGFGARAIPTYVGEWILSRYVEDGELSAESRTRVAQFIAKYLPAKGQKDAVKDTLLRQEVVKRMRQVSESVVVKSQSVRYPSPFIAVH